MGALRIDFVLKMILITFFSLVLSHASWAGDVAVLVDISGSLKNLPVQEGRQLLNDLLIKGQIPSSWEVVAADKENQTVRSLLSDAHQPLIQPGDRLLLLPFGSKRDEKFPYFKNPEIFKVSSLDDASRRLDRFYPQKQEIKEAYTYYELALAVAADLLKKNGATQFTLIAVSDFQESVQHDIPMTPEQARKAAEFRLSKDKNELLSMLYKDRNLLQTRIIEVRAVGPPPPTTQRPDPDPDDGKEIKLLTPRGEIKGDKPNFQWTGLPAAEYYIIRCQGDKFVIKERTQQAHFQYQKDLPSGEYTWQVIAHLANDETVASAKGKFTVKSSGAWWLFVFLIGLGGVGTGIYYRKQLLAWLGFSSKNTGSY